MTQRKSFSKKDRARLFTLYAGECHLCSGKIDGTVEAWEIEHVIPWALTQDDSDPNLRLAHVKCHRVKTVDDRQRISKAERQRLKHMGAWPSSKAKIPSRPFQKARNY